MRIQSRLAAAALALALALPAGAQWLKFKTPGIPRLPDGQPNLAAPAPKMPDGKPDLSGFWRDDTAGIAETSRAMDKMKPLPWAIEAANKHKEIHFSDSPSVRCLPGGPADMGVGKIVQTPNLLLMLSGGTQYREVFLDGRPLPEDPNPTWMGYSVGHWEGNTLVIEWSGFNDKSWLDGEGHPHTEALRITERIQRPDFGHLRVTRTYTDPGALQEPYTVPVSFEYWADTEDIEYVCNENEKDRAHLVGKASDEKTVTVAPELLSKYTGDYEFKFPETGQLVTFTFDVKDAQLVLKGVGPTVTLAAVTDSEFSYSGTIFRFEKNPAGPSKTVIMQAVEGDLKGIRK